MKKKSKNLKKKTDINEIKDNLSNSDILENINIHSNRINNHKNVNTYNEDIYSTNCFRIMITTDNHLGYLENDQIRGDDSFVVFEEILIKSINENVDFILHGGDLFHHHNPSKKTIIRTSNILKKHVFGCKEHNFETYCYNPNYKNKNLSIQLPIFIIHGNHDDPSGLDNFSSIDIYGGKEVNYFGKVYNYEEFDIYPILFVKKETKIAVYGIGNLKDERLYQALENKKVKFNRPKDDTEGSNNIKWFNLLVVHQNRYRGHFVNKTRKNYLPENLIPSFIDLIIWGHEHECFTSAMPNSEMGFHIYQPGSSIPTSLIAGEAKSKHVGIVEIYKNSFRIIPIRLETSRPFIYDNFELSKISMFSELFNKNCISDIKLNNKNGYNLNSDIVREVENYIVNKIENYLKEAALIIDNVYSKANDEIKDLILCNSKMTINQSSNYNENNYNCYVPLKILPIIRLKIETSDIPVPRSNIISSKFYNTVANSNNILQFYKKPKKVKDYNQDFNKFDSITNNKINIKEETLIEDENDIKKFINNYFTKDYYINQKENMSNQYFDIQLFLNVLDKNTNGQSKKSLESMYLNYYKNLTCFSNIKLYNSLNWEYIKNILIDDINILKKDYERHVNNILKEMDFKYCDEININQLDNFETYEIQRNEKIKQKDINAKNLEKKNTKIRKEIISSNYIYEHNYNDENNMFDKCFK